MTCRPTNNLECSMWSPRYTPGCPLQLQLALQQAQLLSACGPLRIACSLQASCLSSTALQVSCQLQTKAHGARAPSLDDMETLNLMGIRDQAHLLNNGSPLNTSRDHGCQDAQRLRKQRGAAKALEAAWTDLGSMRVIVIWHPVAAVLSEAFQRAELPVQQVLQLQHFSERSAAQNAWQDLGSHQSRTLLDPQ